MGSLGNWLVLAGFRAKSGRCWQSLAGQFKVGLVHMRLRIMVIIVKSMLTIPQWRGDRKPRVL